MLVVIDDPVSSFDTNNRYGIISMITNQIRYILKGNGGSKVLFLTHDLLTLNDLVVMREKLKRNRIEKDNGQKEYLPAYLNLNNNKLDKVDKVKDNDYVERLKNVFEYARKDTVEHNDTIGNEIRSLMESYSTFMYQKGIDDVLGDDYILESVPKEVQPMFRDIPARLMLNKSSHGSLYTDTPITEYGVMTPQELHLLARRLLMFLYWTNKNHLFSYLHKDTYTIKNWAKEEERRANAGVV
jgi:wobble nucleotide-excising tRNase